MICKAPAMLPAMLLMSSEARRCIGVCCCDVPLLGQEVELDLVAVRALTCLYGCRALGPLIVRTQLALVETMCAA